MNLHYQQEGSFDQAVAKDKKKKRQKNKKKTNKTRNP